MKSVPAKPTLTPKLRFPEFRDEPGWDVNTLSGACRMQAGQFVAASEIREQPATRSFPCYGGNGLRGYTETYTHEGTYPLIGRQGALCGNVKLGTGKFHATEHAVAATPKQGIDVDWLYYVLNFLSLNQYATGQAQPGLSVDVLEKVPVAIPEQTDEQHHIADCLSSLDDLIGAESQKLDALKAHKKGLMQQLFPREGETVPRLRFPEFRNAGKWVETRLGQIGELIPGLTYSPDDVREDGLLVLRSSNVQNNEIALNDCVYVDPSIKRANLSCPNDILICVRNGSTALIGKSALIPEGMPLCTHGAFMTVFRSQAPQFVFHLFQTSKYQKQVAGDLGATINSINGSQLLKYKFFIPSRAEQHRIASCLSSLDGLIASQGDKFDALKTHKNGLMQKLFPNME